MKTSVILNFGFAKKAQFSGFPHNFSRGIQKSWSQDPGTTSWGSNEKTYIESVLSCVLRDPTPRFVGLSVGRLVGRSPFYFFSVFELLEHTAPAKMTQ